MFEVLEIELKKKIPVNSTEISRSALIMRIIYWNRIKHDRRKSKFN